MFYIKPSTYSILWMRIYLLNYIIHLFSCYLHPINYNVFLVLVFKCLVWILSRTKQVRYFRTVKFTSNGKLLIMSHNVFVLRFGSKQSQPMTIDINVLKKKLQNFLVLTILVIPFFYKALILKWLRPPSP